MTSTTICQNNVAIIIFDIRGYKKQVNGMGNISKNFLVALKNHNAAYNKF